MFVAQSLHQAYPAIGALMKQDPSDVKQPDLFASLTERLSRSKWRKREEKPNMGFVTFRVRGT